jgi:hypothetical protein
VNLIDFQWTRCPDRYEIAVVKENPRDKKSTAHQVITAKSERFESYRPLDGFPFLFSMFADADSTPKGMLAFTNGFGVLGDMEQGPPPAFGRHIHGQMLEELLQHHSMVRRALKAFEQNDPRELIKCINLRRFAGATAIRLQQVAHGGMGVAFVPQSLIQAIWLQFALHASSGAQLMRCERCGTPFTVGTHTGRRNTSKWCSNACKVAAYKQRHESVLSRGGVTK